MFDDYLKEKKFDVEKQEYNPNYSQCFERNNIKNESNLDDESSFEKIDYNDDISMTNSRSIIKNFDNFDNDNFLEKSNSIGK